MKINTKTNKLLLLLTVLFASVMSTGTLLCQPNREPLTISYIKQQLKSADSKKEAELAKRLKVENSGIVYNGEFIPKTNNSNIRVLTVRLTVYWAKGGDTDSDSRKLKSSTGYTLKQGESIAVDPRIIPYTKEVIIPNVGLVKAVDTGTAVKERVASGGKLPVIDVFFVHKKDALSFANNNPKIVKVAVIN